MDRDKVSARAVFLCFWVAVAAGCKTPRVAEGNAEVSRERTAGRAADTVRVGDTITVREYARDSVVVERRGDTVYVDRWHERRAAGERRTARERVSVARDTVAKTDTVVRTVAGKASKGGTRGEGRRLPRAAAWAMAAAALAGAWLAGRRGGRRQE